MLSISNPMKGAGRGDYYLKLAQEDYYLNCIEQRGTWFGRGAERMSLSGKVEREALRNLLLGLSPDGKHPLVMNANKPDRQSGWDLTFSAHKSFSVFWSQAPPDIREVVEQSHQHAVEVALTHLEQKCGVTRRGKGGEIVEPAALTFALFQHSTSRAQDPQLHTHAILLNLGWRQDGTSGAIQSLPVFQEKMVAGAIYQMELAAALRQRLGLTIEPERVGFRIVGVPEKLCQLFSKRRQAIERALAERGQANAVSAKVAALDTRPKKSLVPREELFAQWRVVGQKFGWGEAQVKKLVGHHYNQRIAEQQFNDELLRAIAKVPGVEQERPRMVKLVTALALRHGIEFETVMKRLEANAAANSRNPFHIEWKQLFDPTPWNPPPRQMVRVDWKSLFPNSKREKLKNLKLPVVAVALPKIAVGPQKVNKPKWWSILWKRDLIFAELRVQRRLVCPKAPRWSPLYGVVIPSLRLTTQKSEWKPLKQWKKTDQSHSH
jgi:conjugative relaxase-like TrwC/TraI family protein